MQATEIQEHARKLMEAHGARAVAEAAQKAVAYEKTADAAQARVWRQIEAALKQMQGPVSLRKSRFIDDTTASTRSSRANWYGR